jgi:ribose 1,5-bisphosphokinase
MSGRLIYVMGASGSGKDSLLRLARQSLGRHSGVCFAHRYITRAADAGGENHIALTPSEFQARLRARLFAMHWSSHGLDYGIGLEINHWLARGLTVVLNGSREYLPQAKHSYPDLLPVWIEVSPQVLRARLHARGRESASEIEARLQRPLPESLKRGQPSQLIRNEGPLEDAAAQLIALIEEQARQCSPEPSPMAVSRRPAPHA